MEFLNVFADKWVLNEEDNLKHLLREEVWSAIPSINANEVHNFPEGSLVRFRGMIQDMYGPEYYFEKFNVVNELTNDKSVRNGKYCDGAVSCAGEKICEDADCNVPSERQSYVVTSVPGLNAWVQQHERDKLQIPSRQNANRNKRSIEEVMEVELEATTSKKITSPPQAARAEPKRPSVVSPEHILNHPLPNEKSKLCHIKVYKDSDSLKLNDVCDFVGFLSVSPLAEQMYSEDDGLESQMEIQTHHPPGSLVPRLHVVHFRHLQHVNPLVDQDLLGNMELVKKELLIVLTQLLLGDSLAAEYLICALLSEVYLRRDFMPLGKFALNISNVPKVDVGEVYKFLELLVPASHYLPLTLENMNSLAFTPKKDYECNRLTSGLLQLSKNTLLVLDETKLQEGQLDQAGLQGVRALANAIKNQKVTYDFNYYPIEYDCDISFLIFSEGKSMLPSDIHLILQSDEACVQTFNEIKEAAAHFLKPQLLNDIRRYLTEARLIKYDIFEETQNLVQEEFVNMRQNGNVTAEDLHGLLVLARLVCLSEGKSTLDETCWKKACEMERQRKARNSPLQRVELEGSDKEEDCLETQNLRKLFTDSEDEDSDDYTRRNSVIPNAKFERKYEKDHENLSCYNSASHTDNFSTDEHDSLRDVPLKDLHISDSGTDLTELVIDLETEWQKFWSLNGEKLIWQSWITKYSAYINPGFLDQRKNSGSSGSGSGNQAASSVEKATHFAFDEKAIRALEHSPRISSLTRYLSTSDEKLGNEVSEGWNPLSPLSVEGETEAERLLSSRCGSYTSSRSFRTIDSMTNVTRMTVSSLDIGSSQSSDSISSVSSVDSSNSSEALEEDYQSQWNQLWKQHYEQEYLFQYNKFCCDNRDEESRKMKSEDWEKDATSGDEACYYVGETKDDSLMATMGLPTSFGGSKGAEKTFPEPKGRDTESGRQQVRAAFDLIGMEFLEEEARKAITGKVEYKMRHIRHQNRRLMFGAQNTRFNDEESEQDNNTTEKDRKQKRKRRKRKVTYPPEMEANKKIRKFWQRRFSLFSRFDEGIKLDEESWYSVTPEVVAKHAAQRCACGLIVDAFCGAGGNAIQFAQTCQRVIAIDIDPKKIELAKNNAEIYGVSDKIDFIIGDFFQLATSLKADAVFLSPPWGGLTYTNQKMYDLEVMLQPVGFTQLFQMAEKISKNIAAFLPKNSNTALIIKMAGPGGKVEIEQDFINNKQISLTAYYNGLIKE